MGPLSNPEFRDYENAKQKDPELDYKTFIQTLEKRSKEPKNIPQNINTKLQEEAFNKCRNYTVIGDKFVCND